MADENKQILADSISKKDEKKIKKANKASKDTEGKASDVRGKRYDKKFEKYATSKESQLHAKDFDDGVNKADKRAMKEVLFDSGYIDQVGKFAKGGGVKKNSKRMNDLEELGRVDSEKAYSSKGKKNLKAEKTRIVKSLNSRGAAKRGHGAEIK